MRKLIAPIVVTMLCLAPCAGRAEPRPAAAAPIADGLSVLAVAPAATVTDTVARAAADTAAWTPPPRNFTRAALEVFGINAVVWAYCRYIREGGTNTGFRISIPSYKENLLNGFEWDDNKFKTNQFAHPYHGSMYFAAARANGFDFWESGAFAFAGSIMWEYFGETHHPSINDWISTSVGGISFGEMLHRSGLQVFDNRATGSTRVWHEVGGFLVDPMGGVNRLITGEAERVGPNPPQHDAPVTGALRAGARLTGHGTLRDADTTRAFVRFRWVYGDPTGSVCEKPYDAFTADLQVNFGDASPIGRAEVTGILHSWERGRGPNSASYFALVNTYDYIDSFAYKLGTESFGASLLGRRTSDAWTANAGVTGNWIVMGGTSSDYASFTGRNYDYGPGLGGRLFATLRHRSRAALALESRLYWLHILNGTAANHVLAENRATLSIPVRGAWALGTEYTLYHAERHYADYPDVSTRAPQLSVYLAWLP